MKIFLDIYGLIENRRFLSHALEPNIIALQNATYFFDDINISFVLQEQYRSTTPRAKHITHRDMMFNCFTQYNR